MVDKYLKGEEEKSFLGEFRGGEQGESGGMAPESAGGGWDRERVDGMGKWCR